MFCFYAKGVSSQKVDLISSLGWTNQFETDR